MGGGGWVGDPLSVSIELQVIIFRTRGELLQPSLSHEIVLSINQYLTLYHGDPSHVDESV